MSHISPKRLEQIQFALHIVAFRMHTFALLLAVDGLYLLVGLINFISSFLTLF